MISRLKSSGTLRCTDYHDVKPKARMRAAQSLSDDGAATAEVKQDTVDRLSMQLKYLRNVT